MQDRDLCSVVCYQSLLTGNVQGRKPCKPMELIKSYYDSISDNTQVMQSVSGTASSMLKRNITCLLLLALLLKLHTHNNTGINKLGTFSV